MQGLIDSKKEYTEHIIDLLSIPISKKIYSIYDDCLKTKKTLLDFQKKLNNIKNWNNNIIEEEYLNIIKYSKCDYLSKLFRILLITNIKIKIYEFKDQINNIKFKLPTVEQFIHKCFINCSIFSWKNSYLFWNQNLKQSEKQYHLNIIEKNFKKIIKNTIRDIIPLNDIIEKIEEKLNENNISQINDDKEEDEDEVKVEEDDDEVNEEEDDDEVNEEEDDDEVNEEEEDDDEVNKEEEDDDEVNKEEEDFLNNDNDEIKRIDTSDNEEYSELKNLKLMDINDDSNDDSSSDSEEDEIVEEIKKIEIIDKNKKKKFF